MNEFNISSEIIAKWLKAWSMSRKLPLPVIYKSGFKVDVAYEKQITRYVFPELTDDFIQLSQTLKEPWVFLKVCASKSEVSSVVSSNWEIQPQGYMMSCNESMRFSNAILNDEYKIEFENYESIYIVRIDTQVGELASIGHLVVIDNLAVYDRIFTEPNHQRKGLASCIIKELEKIAVSKGIFNNFLVATEEGKLLYESLGWKLYCLYTSIVIPG
jgi:GNAT superfamily N-acetyltransferase